MTEFFTVVFEVPSEHYTDEIDFAKNLQRILDNGKLIRSDIIIDQCNEGRYE